ncbi:protein SHI RELATED SEQUENCE 1 [Daucus carota subsp. sativus]|uniref:protein SHI RELATED SEQUENCE 1 n=1 Tax=Daucus carota subsp. sativus TaxID=79200 RepID=UPI0007B22D9F|nr:PREDICTED: protein SHI RELATED SEQUENCE 1-like [Daucus carota subsp. sativus]
MSDFFSLGGGGSSERSRGGASRTTTSNINQEEQERSRLNQSAETWNLYGRSGHGPHHDQHYLYSIPPDRIPFELWNQHPNPVLLQPGGAGAGAGGVMAGGEERSGDFLMMSSSSSAGGSGVINCEDCGNQAKKDCTHRRCRTCCTSRGFECQTHVKSTWVSASKRRQRQQQQLQQQQEPQLQQHSDVPKRPRQTHPNPSASGFGNFPPEVRSPAVFNCVRVSSIDDVGEDQFAYQTAVSIGGHVFKGILYDQGPENTAPH